MEEEITCMYCGDDIKINITGIFWKCPTCGNVNTEEKEQINISNKVVTH